MALTPIDVQQKTFGTALRGYDLDEVDDFLDDVVTALKDYEQRLRDAQERIGTLEMERTDHGDAEGAIARALVAAQRSADTIVAEAKEEAQRIVAAAESEASEAVAARDAERTSAESEIERIRSLVTDLRARVHGLAGVVGTTLDEVEGALDEATGDLTAPEIQPVAETVSPDPDPMPPWTARSDEHESQLEPSPDGADSDDEPAADEDEPVVSSDWTTPAVEEPAIDRSWSVADREDDEDGGHTSRPWEVG